MERISHWIGGKDVAGTSGRSGLSIITRPRKTSPRIDASMNKYAVLIYVGRG